MSNTLESCQSIPLYPHTFVIPRFIRGIHVSLFVHAKNAKKPQSTQSFLASLFIHSLLRGKIRMRVNNEFSSENSKNMNRLNHSTSPNLQTLRVLSDLVVKT